jgi:hypothetical protein
MAIVQCITEDLEVLIEIRLSPEEAKVVIATWDIDLKFKQALTDAVNCAYELKGGVS